MLVAADVASSCKPQAEMRLQRSGRLTFFYKHTPRLFSFFLKFVFFLAPDEAALSDIA